ncbi:hypothetical protein DMB38_24845 [Streptomyces sp. WAC 06738]|uniref:hypothetical protein n=1 Tax=Streptomyces sp. WAC 06738 TaxID=2203210 RepID=UPI000F6F47C1|nr:hypothetical protein [Streptomyces sp. WAC 06738]AZM48583.1 hypothetical protein DMB38_24845 [Streptomyces sp. WAC 06738]
MTPKRGDEVAPPAAGEEWCLRFATNEAAKGWGELCAAAPANTRRCYEALRSAPVSLRHPDRQHRLRGRLAEGVLGGTAYPQWEYEVTSGGRVRYLVDEARRTVHFVYASPRHPKDTDV